MFRRSISVWTSPVVNRAKVGLGNQPELRSLDFCDFCFFARVGLVLCLKEVVQLGLLLDLVLVELSGLLSVIVDLSRFLSLNVILSFNLGGLLGVRLDVAVGPVMSADRAGADEIQRDCLGILNL